MKIRGSLDRSEIDALLSENAIPLRLACRTPSGPLWMLSLWYRYREGTLECATSASADVVAYLREDPHVAFEVSTNDPPYRGVRGNGSAAIDPDPEKAVLRDLLERYLGSTEVELGRRLLRKERDEVRIRIDPAVVYGWDFADRMADVVD